MGEFNRAASAGSQRRATYRERFIVENLVRTLNSRENTPKRGRGCELRRSRNFHEEKDREKGRNKNGSVISTSQQGEQLIGGTHGRGSELSPNANRKKRSVEKGSDHSNPGKRQPSLEKPTLAWGRATTRKDNKKKKQAQSLRGRSKRMTRRPQTT